MSASKQMQHFPWICDTLHALRLPSKHNTVPSATKPKQSGHSNKQLLIAQQHAENGTSSVVILYIN